MDASSSVHFPETRALRKNWRSVKRALSFRATSYGGSSFSERPQVRLTSKLREEEVVMTDEWDRSDTCCCFGFQTLFTAAFLLCAAMIIATTLCVCVCCEPWSSFVSGDIHMNFALNTAPAAATEHDEVMGRFLPSLTQVSM